MKTTRRRFWMNCFLVGILMLAVGAAGLAQEGTFRVAMQPPTRIDPAIIDSDSEIAIANAVYDYLVDVGPDNAIQLRLAESVDISADGLTYTFILADNVRFHDGTPLVPGDVVWTFDRLRNPDNGFPTASLYENIESIEVMGSDSVAFHLINTNPFFLYDLSDNHALILKRGTTDFTTFNGTGPFVVTDYRPDDRILMTANDAYFIEGLPGLDELQFIFFTDSVTAVGALRGGQIEMAWRMPVSLYVTLQGEQGINTVDVPTNGFDLVRLRTDQAPGDNPLVIQALKHATDREAIFQLVQLGAGSIGRDTPIGPLYNEFFDASIEPLAYDPARARDLLAQAGYADGLSIDLYAPDTGDRPVLAVVLKEQWAQVGVDINVIIEPESVYFGENHWMDATLGITNWGSRPYPQFYLDLMLACDASWNEARFCDNAFDALIHVAGTTLDAAARVFAYSQIQQTLVTNGPIIIPYFWPQVAAYNNRFAGLELKAFAGRTDFRNIFAR
ncbi:ABC transporter substrate-binding protein [Candidatus Bipolaricaulota bacterium]|nr:ABC transporter substrate-binding protein [Candidatus Bipolaricaulota bacterium]